MTLKCIYCTDEYGYKDAEVIWNGESLCMDCYIARKA